MNIQSVSMYNTQVGFNANKKLSQQDLNKLGKVVYDAKIDSNKIPSLKAHICSFLEENHCKNFSDIHKRINKDDVPYITSEFVSKIQKELNLSETQKLKLLNLI